mgnify:CR=1 FL=1
MLGVLSDKVREGQMIIIEDLLLENGKTKEMIQILADRHVAAQPVAIRVQRRFCCPFRPSNTTDC